MNNTNPERWKYLLFLAIGILSFLIGELWREDIFHIGVDGPGEIYFTLLVYAVLFTAGLIISKERTIGFIVKAFTISFIVLFLAFSGFFVWGAHEHYYAKYIDANRLQTAPDEFVILTAEELNEYPALKETIMSQKPVKVHPDEWGRIDDFLDQKGSRDIKVNEEYYSIMFMTA